MENAFVFCFLPWQRNWNLKVYGNKCWAWRNREHACHKTLNTSWFLKNVSTTFFDVTYISAGTYVHVYEFGFELKNGCTRKKMKEIKISACFPYIFFHCNVVKSLTSVQPSNLFSLCLCVCVCASFGSGACIVRDLLHSLVDVVKWLFLSYPTIRTVRVNLNTTTQNAMPLIICAFIRFECTGEEVPT